MDNDKTCGNCKYNYGSFTCDEKDKDTHCFKCIGFSMFLPMSSEYPKISCKDCTHYKTDPTKKPCSMCIEYGLFKGKKHKRKMCSNCKYVNMIGFEEPCRSCYAENKWEKQSLLVQSDSEIVTIPNSDVTIVDDISEVSPAGNGAENLKEIISNAVNNFHFSLDPCKMCKYESDELTCKTCCYFYASEFELKEIK